MVKIKRIYIEIGNICNLNCSFCSPLNRQKQIMSEKDFIHILNEIKLFPDAQLYFHVKGEPLMHPYLEKYLVLADKYNRKVNITTNGTLLNKMGDVLLNSPSVRQVNISVHCLENVTKKVQQDYINAIAQFGLKAKSTDKIVSYRMWNGIDEISEQNKYSLKLLCDYFNVEYSDELEKSREAIKLGEHIFISYQDEFVWPSLSLDFISNKGNCLGGKNMLAILVDGRVCPCCLDGDGVINLGNIFSSPLKDILSSDRYKNLLAGFCGGNISEELCQKCMYRTRFDKNK